MRFVIVTGVSGAGKTAALKMLEDMGYFCVDNLPIQLLEKFASLLPEMQSENVRNVALGIDARSGSALDELEVVLDRMKQTGYDYEILFMDAEDSVLVKRYSFLQMLYLNIDQLGSQIISFAAPSARPSLRSDHNVPHSKRRTQRHRPLILFRIRREYCRLC